MNIIRSADSFDNSYKFEFIDINSSNFISERTKGSLYKLEGGINDDVLKDTSCDRIKFSLYSSIKDNVFGDLIKVEDVPVIHEAKDTFSIHIGNNNFNITTNYEGIVSSEGFTTDITFIAYLGTSRVSCTYNNCENLPTGMTVTLIQSCTDTSSGILRINVSGGSTLDDIDFENIKINFTYNSKSYEQYFSWSKSKDGKDGLAVEISSLSVKGDYVGQISMYNGIFYRWDGNTWNINTSIVNTSTLDDLTPKYLGVTESSIGSGTHSWTVINNYKNSTESGYSTIYNDSGATSTQKVVHEGDTVLQKSSGNIYSWGKTNGWTLSNTREHMSKGFDDLIILAKDNTDPSEYVTKYLQNFVAVNAFIENLETSTIHIHSTDSKKGCIYSGGYNEDGNWISGTTKTSGVFINEDGVKIRGNIQVNTISDNSGNKIPSSSIVYYNFTNSTPSPPTINSDGTISYGNWNSTRPVWRGGDTYSGYKYYICTKRIYVGGDIDFSSVTEEELVVESIVPIYNFSKDSVSRPTSIITQSSTSVTSTWTLGTPTVTDDKLTYNIWTCNQIKYTNTSYGWTTPVLNNTLVETYRNAKTSTSAASSSRENASESNRILTIISSESIKDQIMIYFLTNDSSKVTQPTKNTTISTSDTTNTWTTVIPTYVENYTYYSCIKYTFMDNSISFSTYRNDSTLNASHTASYMLNHTITNYQKIYYAKLRTDTDWGTRPDPPTSKVTDNSGDTKIWTLKRPNDSVTVSGVSVKTIIYSCTQYSTYENKDDSSKYVYTSVTLDYDTVIDSTNGYIRINMINVNDLFAQSITVKTGGSIQSETKGTDGKPSWIISTDGSAIFQNATVTGTINASSGTFNGTVNASSGVFTNTITVGKSDTTGSIQSLATVSSTDTTPLWKISSDGTAMFQKAVINGISISSDMTTLDKIDYYSIIIDHNKSSRIGNPDYRDSIHIGKLSGANLNKSHNNIAIGVNSLYGTNIETTDISLHNIAIGNNAMKNSANCSYNIAIGLNSLVNIGKSSCYNVAIGEGSCNDLNFKCEGSTCIGFQSGKGITTGNYNTLIGSSSGSSISSGTENVCIGYNSDISSKSYGIAIGSGSDVQSNYGIAIGKDVTCSQTKGIAIGYGASVTEEGMIALGSNLRLKSTIGTPTIRAFKFSTSNTENDVYTTLVSYIPYNSIVNQGVTVTYPIATIGHYGNSEASSIYKYTIGNLSYVCVGNNIFKSGSSTKLSYELVILIVT